MDKVAYWSELAEYDIGVAELMFTGGRWLYVGFMCHQVIEKMLKAYWSAKKPDDIPYTHNLLKLIQSTGLMHQLTEEQLEFVSELMPLNIEGRYPDYKRSVAIMLNREYSEELIAKTKELYLWIKNKL